MVRGICTVRIIGYSALDRHGADAGKKVKGRKRHILTDTVGFMLLVIVHAADVQDRDGATALLKAIRHRFPWLRHVFADGGYTGDKLRDALKGNGDWTIEIIKRSHTAKGFELLPRRYLFNAYSTSCAAVWYRKTNLTFSDAIGIVRHTLWVRYIYRQSPQNPEPPEMPPDRIKRMADALCFAA